MQEVSPTTQSHPAVTLRADRTTSYWAVHRAWSVQIALARVI